MIVEGTFATSKTPLPWSSTQTSVNVPPTSTATTVPVVDLSMRCSHVLSVVGGRLLQAAAPAMGESLPASAMVFHTKPSFTLQSPSLVDCRPVRNTEGMRSGR